MSSLAQCGANVDVDALFRRITALEFSTNQNNALYTGGTIGNGVQLDAFPTVRGGPFRAIADGIADDAIAIQTAIDSVATSSSTYKSIYIPDGYYRVLSTIILRPGVTLVASKNAIIGAGAGMSALIQSPADQTLFDVGFFGGRLHCNDLADVGLDLQWFQHYKLTDTYIENYKSVGARFGVAGTAFSSFEPMVRGLKTFRNTGAIGVGSKAVHLRTATDGKFSQCILGGAETGILSNSGGHFFDQVHCWNRAASGTLKYGFDDQAGTNTYVACHADTPNVAGYRLAFGNVVMSACRAFMNSLSGNDNVADGVLITSVNPNCAILGFQCIGTNASFRFKSDINYAAVASPTTTMSVYGTVSNNVVTLAGRF